MTGSRPAPSGRLVIQTILDTAHFWILVPVEVGDGLLINFVLDSGSPLTSMSERLYNRLRPYLRQIGKNRYILRPVRLAGHDLGSLNIRGSDFLSRVGADGVLGLDFLTRFTHIEFDVPTLLLTLGP